MYVRRTNDPSTRALFFTTHLELPKNLQILMKTKSFLKFIKQMNFK